MKYTTFFKGGCDITSRWRDCSSYIVYPFHLFFFFFVVLFYLWVLGKKNRSSVLKWNDVNGPRSKYVHNNWHRTSLTLCASKTYTILYCFAFVYICIIRCELCIRFKSKNNITAVPNANQASQKRIILYLTVNEL